MKLKLIATIVTVFCLLAGQVAVANSRADTSLPTLISDQALEHSRLDIATVINESILELMGGNHTDSLVRFSSLALKELRKERFHYEGFSDFHYAVNRFAKNDKTGEIELGAIISFTDTLLRRSSISMLLTCRWMKNDVRVVKAKLKQLVPPKIMSVLFVVSEEKVPKTLLKEGNHAKLMQWLSHNALAVNDRKNAGRGMYYLFAANLDRLEAGAKVQLRISAQQEGGDGNTYGGLDIDYEGWHVAIAKIDKKILFNTTLFAKLIYTAPDYDGTGKGLLRIGLFPLDFEAQQVKSITDTVSIADAYVYAYNYHNWNQSNRGKYDQLRAGWHPTGGESRAYIKFDLSNVDPSKVTKAVLKLYHFQTAGNDNVDLGIYRVTGPWKEGTDTYHSGRAEKTAAPGELSWVQQPPIDTQAVSTFNPGHGLGDWTEVDITPLVKQWLNGTPNYGLIIKPVGSLASNTPASVYHFASRERRADLDNPKGESKAPTLILSASSGGSNAINHPVTAGYLLSGTYQVEQGRYKSTWKLRVSNGRISGTSEWDCCPGHRIDAVRGTLSGNSVVLERDCSGEGWNGSCRQTYRGKIKGDRITGPCTGTGLTAGDTWVLYLDTKL